MDRGQSREHSSPRRREQQVQMCRGVMDRTGQPGIQTRFRGNVIREMEGTDQVAVMELWEAARVSLSGRGAS